METMVEIKDLLLRIAKLYAIKDFDAESSVLLAEWILDEYKHSSIEIVRQALKNPPILKDKTWRITPEVISQWIDTTRERIFDEKMRRESELRQNKKVEFPELSEKVDELLKETASKLASQIENDKKNRLKVLEEMKAIKREDEERIEGKKSIANSIDREQYKRNHEMMQKLMAIAEARGLTKLGLHELKVFKVEGIEIRCRTLDEAQEIYLELV